MFSYEIYEIVKNTYFKEHLLATAFVGICIVCKRFAVKILLWSLEVVIHKKTWALVRQSPTEY